jgi:hypothetical protein
MRVIAIENIKDGIMRSYGEGMYIGDKVPNIEPFNTAEIKNPCIKLDSGKYVWGFQCWWGEVIKTREKFKDMYKEEVIVELNDEVLPMEM